MVRRTIAPLLILCMAITACAATDGTDESRKSTAIPDFIAVNELEPISSIRVRDPLSSVDVDDKYVLINVRKQRYLVEYFSRCIRYTDGRVEPDVRRDPRRIFARADTFRGCRIKTIYVLDHGQAEEVREIGRSVGGGR